MIVNKQEFFKPWKSFNHIIEQKLLVVWHFTASGSSLLQTVPWRNYNGRRLCRWHSVLENTPAQAKSLLHSLEQAAWGIGLHENANKKFMYFKREGAISKRRTFKLVDSFLNLGSSVSSTERDINMHLVKAWTAIDWLSISSKPDLSEKIKCDFFQATVVSILQYGGSSWMLTKCIEKKLDGNCTRMLRGILNKSPRNNSCTATYLQSLKLSK